ncbi:hypothetical protein OG756_40755 [Streptomyces sp. NBC_01310]|uniref:hypothetical protein n=1 Tax=Streptomyces sp. NBC_01310 TaxID=2903820 RepID=UPI0035B6A897|nr:hypothetical protein OG756_00640 [Streptomyces sp. NBC_01310]WSJ63750.1 hypothetical protein OG756_40755 [Streptomyces sp. NBC_01310]
MTPDPVERARAMEGIYTEDIEILEPEDVFVGRDTINDYIAVVQSKAPPLSGRITSHTQNKDYILWGWDFGFPGDKRALGTEVLHMRGDLIEKIVIFSGDGDVFTEGTR